MFFHQGWPAVPLTVLPALQEAVLSYCAGYLPAQDSVPAHLYPDIQPTDGSIHPVRFAPAL